MRGNPISAFSSTEKWGPRSDVRGSDSTSGVKVDPETEASGLAAEGTGTEVGDAEGESDGADVGAELGSGVRDGEGSAVGVEVGVGVATGVLSGDGVKISVGVGEGSTVGRGLLEGVGVLSIGNDLGSSLPEGGPMKSPFGTTAATRAAPNETNRFSPRTRPANTSAPENEVGRFTIIILCPR